MRSNASTRPSASWVLRSTITRRWSARPFPTRCPCPFRFTVARGSPARDAGTRSPRFTTRTHHVLLPEGADRGPDPQGPAAVAAAEVAPQASRSIERSSVGAEWVSAPTEMKSTPVAEIAATVSSETPPEASSGHGRAAPAIARRDGGPQTVEVHVVEQEAGRAGREGRLDLGLVPALHLYRQLRVGGAGAGDRLRQTRRPEPRGSP